jgi:hypothetical protein
MRSNTDDDLIRAVIDELHEIVKLRGGVLRGNQMRLLYERLPEAKRIVKEQKLPVLCDASDGRLKFIADNSSGRIVEGISTGVAELNVKKKKKKKKKKKEVKLNLPNLPWTEDADIPENVVAAMVVLVQEPKVEEQIKVNRRYFKLEDLTSGRHQDLFQLICEKDGVKNKHVRCLILEMQKGTAERNKEQLYESVDHEDRLQVMRDEICPPTGHFSLNDIIARLRRRANDLNVTTTDLGRALAGSSNVSAAYDEHNRNTSDVAHFPVTHGCDNRRTIAKATVFV